MARPNLVGGSPDLMAAPTVNAALPREPVFSGAIAQCKQTLQRMQYLQRAIEDLNHSLVMVQARQGKKREEDQAYIERKLTAIDEIDWSTLKVDTKGIRKVFEAPTEAAKNREPSKNRKTSVENMPVGLNSETQPSSRLADHMTIPSYSGDSSQHNGGNVPVTSGAVSQSSPRRGLETRHVGQPTHKAESSRKHVWPLEAEEYKRYGRQLIMPEVGLQGQLRLKRTKVLIVGAGGLGCPAAAYLAGAGVGELGIVDGDTVELSNLHRQILHGVDTVGMLKVESAIARLKTINPLVHYRSHKHALSPSNALEILAQYDLVLDCTDRPTSRYLISDACVVFGLPLVSASALRTDGQLTVLNHPSAPPGDPSGGPCYRCVWPTPPPPETVVGCGEGGILGPVVGVMGVFMALEALKIITTGGLEKPEHFSGGTPSIKAESSSTSSTDSPSHNPTMLLLSATSPRPTQSIRLQPRRKDCTSCSSQATITASSISEGSLDYVAFCGLMTPVALSAPEQRITPADYAVKHMNADDYQGLIDVRDKTQFELFNLPGSTNVPWTQIERWKSKADVDPAIENMLASNRKNITFVCREGNDSQLAVQKMQELGFGKAGDDGNGIDLKDIIGGWNAWRRDVDADWPDY